MTALSVLSSDPSLTTMTSYVASWSACCQTESSVFVMWCSPLYVGMITLKSGVFAGCVALRFCSVVCENVLVASCRKAEILLGREGWAGLTACRSLFLPVLIEGQLENNSSAFA